MRVLIINKFLYPNGGSETYIFKLGEALEQHGHEVQYFGMEHEGRCVGNRVNAYTSDMDFHGGSKLSKLTYPIKTIYSKEARVQLRKVLDDFQPDVCHLNNFNYQLTPSMILEIVKWRKETGKDCKIVFTAHDYQLVCPNHQLKNPITHENCEKCLGGHFVNCAKGKCVHGSTAKSIVGMMEAEFWKWNGAYKYIDKIICCSEFLKTKMDTNPLFATKTIAMHNFVEKVEPKEVEKKDYVLYFGRFSEEKGINTLVETCNLLPDIQFIFAGSGPLEDKVNQLKNVKNVGFQTGDALDKLIREAKFSICPSEVYENCPFSIMESQQRGTPVIGASIGGIPELITDGVDEDKKVTYDKNYIEDLYLRYMATGKSQEEHKAELTESLNGKTILLIAPGKSSIEEKDGIISFVNEDVVTVSVNYNYPLVDTDYIFLSNLRRFRELGASNREKCIVTSNIPADNVYLQTKYRDLLCDIEAVKDNAGLMAIKFFAKMGVKKIYLAGFDGYSHDEKENYGESTMAFVTKTAILDAMNHGMTEMLKKYSELVELNFLTKPHYVKI